MKTDKKKSLLWELIRFAITGIVCALFDYLVCQLVILAFNQSLSDPILVTIISMKNLHFTRVNLMWIKNVIHF